MLEELSIRNYRIFRELKIDQLRRINLIAGSNNSGKTSLLEAIFLLASGRAEMAVNGHVARVDLEPGSRGVGDNFWKPFFTDLDMRRSIEIEAFHSSHGRLALKITSGRQEVSEILVEATDGYSATNLPDEHTLFFEYDSRLATPSRVTYRRLERRSRENNLILIFPLGRRLFYRVSQISKKMPDVWQT